MQQVPSHYDSVNQDTIFNELRHFAEQQQQLDPLSAKLLSIAQYLEQRYQELVRLSEITAHINLGFLLDEVLDRLYQDFKDVVPYDRLGLALIDCRCQNRLGVWFL